MQKKPDLISSSARRALSMEIARSSTAPTPELPSSFTYMMCQDFGVQIKKLLFSCSSQKNGISIERIVKNMQGLSRQLGFELISSKNAYFVRDSWLGTAKMLRFVPSDSEHVDKAIERACSLQFFQGKKPAYLTAHDFFKTVIGGPIKAIPRAIHDYREITGSHAVPQLAIYLEGGNYFCISNRDNQPILFVGEDLMPIVHNQLRLQGAFNIPELSLEKRMKPFADRLTSDSSLLRTTVLEMYAQGLLRVNDKDGMIDKLDILKLLIEFNLPAADHKMGPKKSYTLGAPVQEKGDHFYLKKAVEKNLFTHPTLPKDLNKYTPNAAKYLAQKEITEIILATTFSVEKMFVIPQLFFHLDLFLRPGPKGSFFGLDFDYTIKCLQEITSKQAVLELSTQDQELLQSYLKAAQTFQREIGHLLLQVRQVINTAGFSYLPVPGFFLSESKRQHVNFFNAITGWSPKTKRYYYINSGTSAGDRLGKILQEVFESSLKQYCPEIDVHYVGYNPSSPENFSEADQLFNGFGLEAGVHCLSFEWETVPHKA